MKGFSLFCWSCIFPLFAAAQTLPPDTLATVEIRALALRRAAVGNGTQHYTAAQLQQLPAQNIADLLQQEAGIFVKTYGSGSLATSSIRGGSAGHTLVLWNDLPLHSPTLGLLDLSLLPTFVAENVTVQRGGETAMWGSGAVGGIISLSNEALFHRVTTLNAQINFGSFGTQNYALTLKTGNASWQSHTKISYQKANNDFTYALTPTLQRQQENAAFRQINALQSVFFRPKKSPSHTFATHFWYQNSVRQIPATTAQTRSEAYQHDDAIRLVGSWQNVRKRSIWNAKAAFFYENLDFFDPLIRLEALSHFATFFGETDVQIPLSANQKIYIGTTHTHTQAQTDGYRTPAREYRAALFAAHHWQTARWRTQLSLRQEYIGNVLAPLTPALGIERALGQHFRATFNLSKNYRFPTLNDRFWQLGGNPDLQPEVGWSQSLGLRLNKQWQGLRLQASATAFNRTMENWILWSIADGQAFWSANNIAKVWSRGTETEMQLEKPLGATVFRFSAGHNWVRSTNQIALTRPKIDAGQQLFYTPEHQSFGRFSAAFRRIECRYTHRFVGASLGVLENLSPYQVGELHLSGRYTLKKRSILATITVQNLWNTPYFIVERRPMAGRGVFFQVIFN